MPAHGADERRGKRRTVSPRHHRHVERRGARRGEDIAFGRDVRIHAVGQQPQQGPALADVDMQHAAVSHIGVHALHESVFGDQGLDGRQLYRINCRAVRLDSAVRDPLAHHAARHQIAHRRAVHHLDLDPADLLPGTQPPRRRPRINDICGHGAPQKREQCVSEVFSQNRLYSLIIRRFVFCGFYIRRPGRRSPG